jgi:cyanoexosortase A
MTDFNLTQLFKRPQYGLLAILACLSGIHLAIVWRTGDIAYFGMSILFLLATATLVWENYPKFSYRQDLTASLTGIGLIGWVLWQSLGVTSDQQIELRLFPLVSALAVALLASGFQGILQYRRELAIMFFLGVPNILLHMVDIAPLTAKFAATLLSYAGYAASHQGVWITSSAGTIEVYRDCSGMEGATYLLGIAVVCLTLYPVRRPKQIVALLAAALIGFTVNGARVAIMATLAAPQDQAAFLYWHEGDGSLIFAVLAVALFAGFYWTLHRLEVWQCSKIAHLQQRKYQERQFEKAPGEEEPFEIEQHRHEPM